MQLFGLVVKTGNSKPQEIEYNFCKKLSKDTSPHMTISLIAIFSPALPISLSCVSVAAVFTQLMSHKHDTEYSVLSFASQLASVIKCVILQFIGSCSIN